MQQGWPSMAKEMGEMARLLGYEGELILEEKARDTRENAKLLRPLLQDKSFLLVTSGYHMPRAMGLFRGQGLHPIAASAEIKRWPRNNFKRDQLVPRAIHLSNMSKAQHEYIGLLWASLRGQIGKAPGDDSPPREQLEPEPEDKSKKGQSDDKSQDTESD